MRRRFPAPILANEHGGASSIGSLAGAVIGGIIGSYFPVVGTLLGASIGATLGGLAGGLYETANLDDTVNRQESLADLRIQTSTLGQAIPQVFGGLPETDVDFHEGLAGGGRLAGNIIWATEKQRVEHRETQRSGGKGGGGPSTITITNTYTISLALALCDTRVSGPLSGPEIGLGVQGLVKVWKQANLVYDIRLTPVPDNWTWYEGTADQLPDPTMEAIKGVGNVPGYRYLAYIVMTDEDLGPSGQLPLWSWELGQLGDDQLLPTVVEKLCTAAGLSGAALDVSLLPAVPVQMVLTSIEAVRASLEQLAFAYRFYGLESGVQYAWRPIGTGGIVATIPGADGSAGEDRPAETGAQLDRASTLELPTLQYLTYNDAAQNYQRNTQPSAVILPGSGRENPKNVTTPLTLTADQARRLSTELVALSWVQREPYADTLPRKYCFLEPGDKINAEVRGLTYPVVLASTTYGAPGLLEVVGRVNGSPRLGTVETTATMPVDGVLSDATTIPSGAVVTPGTQTPGIVEDTTPVLLNLPVLSSSDQSPRYHVAYVGVQEPWPGGGLYRSVDSEASYQLVDAGSLEAITGTVALALPNVDWTVIDDTTTLTVVLEYGTLTPITDAALEAGVVRAMIGDEMVYIGVPDLVAPMTYDCTHLWRGRQGTEWAVGTHGTNEVFVLIDSAVHAVAMRTEERGISYDYKAVTRGQAIADATSVTFAGTAENLIPWRVTTPVASRPVQDWQLRWYLRSRFVEGGFDPDFQGFRVTIFADASFTTVKRTIDTSGGYAMSATALKGLSYSAMQQTADFGAVQTILYWTVAQQGAYALGRVQNITSTDLATVQGDIEPGAGIMPSMTWVEVVGTTQAMATNVGYGANNASLVTLTLPTTAAFGDVVEVVGKGAGGWKITQASGQRVHFGVLSSTAGATGFLASGNPHDSVTLRCMIANTEWVVDSLQGTVTVH